jgi:Domain of unknown function (DUF6542)
MTTSAQGSAGQWGADAWATGADEAARRASMPPSAGRHPQSVCDDELAALGRDDGGLEYRAFGGYGLDDQDGLAHELPARPWADSDDAVESWADDPSDGWASSPAQFASPRTARGQDASAGQGLTGRALVLTTTVAAGGCAVLDLMLTSGRMTFFFDLCFVVISLVAAMAVRRADLFTAGVLPPLLFAAVIAAVTVIAPQAFESASGASQVFLTGLANHAPGLVGGYAAALLAVAARMAGSVDRPG